MTVLNPVGFCCVAMDGDPSDPCALRYEYVGPRKPNGDPDPPLIPSPFSYWVKTEHGVMAAIYAALVAPEDEAGTFYATYSECDPDGWYFPQGITPEVRSQIYDASKQWAGIAGA